ncbi:RNA polymerase sigma factor [Chitinophaga japonensis]|nr:sigma-70 family RNA polymerase sigma factor [Chitinophaga japonensis]
MSNELDYFEDLKLGKEEALTALYTANRKWLMLAAESILGPGSTMESQDLVQDVFIEFLEKKQFKNIHDPKAIRGYLHKAIYYRCMDRLRKKKVVSGHLEDFKKCIDKIQLPTQRLENKDLELRLSSAIKLIPDQSAKVLTLSHFHYLKRNEIAAKLNVSPSTVKNHLTNAHKLLRTLLKKDLL